VAYDLISIFIHPPFFDWLKNLFVEKSLAVLRFVLSFVLHLQTLLLHLPVTYAAGVSQPKVLLFYDESPINFSFNSLFGFRRDRCADDPLTTE
jgi:hypothetical protein